MGLNLKDGKHPHSVVGSSSRFCVPRSIRSLPGTGFSRDGATHFEKDELPSSKSHVPMWPVGDVESLEVFTSHNFVIQSPKSQNKPPKF